MDPNKPLIAGNIIPQCQKCNRGDRNRWVYDEKGRVIKLANPQVIKTCDKEVRKKFIGFCIMNLRGKILIP
jgi:hypothetical protein